MYSMSKNKVSIILTTTVNVTRNTSFQVDKNDRINTYVKSIRLWLINTNLNIIVVENSDYSFPELEDEKELYKNRFEVITYSEKTEREKIIEYQMHLDSKGGCEINSIWYAYNMSKLLQKSLFIIKITGRFFIPQFDLYWSKFNLDRYDCLRQNFDNRCEIVGTHIKNFSVIFDKNLFVANGIYNYHVEDVYTYRFSIFNRVIVCPKFNISPTQRGGLDEYYKQL